MTVMNDFSPDELVAAMLAVAPDPEALDRLTELAATELPAGISEAVRAGLVLKQVGTHQNGTPIRRWVKSDATGDPVDHSGHLRAVRSAVDTHTGKKFGDVMADPITQKDEYAKHTGEAAKHGAFVAATQVLAHTPANYESMKKDSARLKAAFSDYDSDVPDVDRRLKHGSGVPAVEAAKERLQASREYAAAEIDRTLPIVLADFPDVPSGGLSDDEYRGGRVVEKNDITPQTAAIMAKLRREERNDGSVVVVAKGLPARLFDELPDALGGGLVHREKPRDRR